MDMDYFYGTDEKGNSAYLYRMKNGSDKMQTYILYKFKTTQHNFNTVSIQYQHSVKFQDFNVNTVSTQYQHSINH